MAQDADRKQFASVVGLTKGQEMNLKMTAAAAIAALMMAGGGASAAIVNTTTCPDPADFGDREFTLNTDEPVTSTCYYTGDQNDNNDTTFNDNRETDFGATHTLISKVELATDDNDTPILDDDGNEVILRFGTDPNLLNQSVVGLLGGTTGTFTLDTTGYDNPLLVFKTGTGGTTPGFAAFLLSPSGETGGSWSVTFNQGLSHVSLYGSESISTSPRISTIPLPAAGWLLLAGIGGLAAFRRRKSV